MAEQRVLEPQIDRWTALLTLLYDTQQDAYHKERRIFLTIMLVQYKCSALFADNYLTQAYFTPHQISVHVCSDEPSE
jgi:hypothetical protein